MEENLTLFGWIATVSPWWWVAFGVALGAVEMATMSFFLIWPALAALAVAALTALLPPMSGEVIVSLWAILSVVLTFAGRALMHRFGNKHGADAGLNSRATRLVGRTAKVLDWSHDEGAVEIDGMRWRAVPQDGATPAVDGRVRIVSADGMTLTVTSA